MNIPQTPKPADLTPRDNTPGGQAAEPGTTEGGLDTSSVDAAAADAVALYGAVQNAAIGFEFATAGAKLGKDKAKAVTG